MSFAERRVIKMKIEKVLIIEDSTTKYMDIYKYLKKKGIPVIEHTRNAEDALVSVESFQDNKPYDLIISDMHFNYFGEDNREAGERTMALFHEKGYDISTIFCSSQNWKIPGAIGNIFYNPRRDWEFEADKLFDELRIDNEK